MPWVWLYNQQEASSAYKRMSNPIFSHIEENTEQSCLEIMKWEK